MVEHEWQMRLPEVVYNGGEKKLRLRDNSIRRINEKKREEKEKERERER
jgi:hypothetical protein